MTSPLSPTPAEVLRIVGDALELIGGATLGARTRLYREADKLESAAQAKAGGAGDEAGRGMPCASGHQGAASVESPARTPHPVRTPQDGASPAFISEEYDERG